MGPAAREQGCHAPERIARLPPPETALEGSWKRLKSATGQTTPQASAGGVNEWHLVPRDRWCDWESRGLLQVEENSPDAKTCWLCLLAILVRSLTPGQLVQDIQVHIMANLQFPDEVASPLHKANT